MTVVTHMASPRGSNGRLPIRRFASHGLAHPARGIPLTPDSAALRFLLSKTHPAAPPPRRRNTANPTASLRSLVAHFRQNRASGRSGSQGIVEYRRRGFLRRGYAAKALDARAVPQPTGGGGFRAQPVAHPPPREGRTNPPQGGASVGWFWGGFPPRFPCIYT